MAPQTPEMATTSLPVGFDPERAQCAVAELVGTKIVDLLHVTHAPDMVEIYARAMADGTLFPPISVVRLGGRYFIADGHKRFQAWRTLGQERLIVQLWPWSRVFADLVLQLGRFLTRAGRACTGPFRGPAGRRETTAFVRSTALHWFRLARSLRDFLSRRDRTGAQG